MVLLGIVILLIILFISLYFAPTYDENTQQFQRCDNCSHCCKSLRSCNKWRPVIPITYGDKYQCTKCRYRELTREDFICPRCKTILTWK